MFVWGKKKQNIMKATVITARRGRTLRTDAMCPGPMHDCTSEHTADIDACSAASPA